MWPFTESQQSVIISIIGFILAFLVTSYYVKFRYTSGTQISVPNEASDYVLESLLSQYSARFETLTKMVGEIKFRLDTLQIPLQESERDSSSSRANSNNSRLLQSVMDIHDTDGKASRTHLQLCKINHGRLLVPAGNDTNVTSQNKNDITKITNVSNIGTERVYEDDHVHKGITFVVLELLSESAMTAREIQSNIRKTREHTSRVMKKLYSQSLVSRDVQAKPYVYRITDEGRTLLKAFHSDAKGRSSVTNNHYAD
jgi:DNA-binding HxlR family transcriptional regulator